jgi:hypothetical protein
MISPAEWSARMARIATERADRNALIASPPAPFTAPLHSGEGRVLVHPSTDRAGAWQTTLFLAGEPVAHVGPVDWAPAVNAAYTYGADLTRRARPV